MSAHSVVADLSWGLVMVAGIIVGAVVGLAGNLLAWIDTGKVGG